MKLVYTTILYIAISLLSVGCAAPVEKKFNSETWNKQIAMANKMIAENDTFRKSHKYKGQVGRVAWDKLGEESFKCALEYREHMVADEKHDPYLYLKNVPIMFCVGPPLTNSDVCANFNAAINIDWENPNVGLSELMSQLEKRAIISESYFCTERKLK